MKNAIIFLIRMYQKVLSPDSGWLRVLYFSPIFNLNSNMVSGCNQNPTCSEYCVDVVDQYGVWRGARLTLKRLVKCR